MTAKSSSRFWLVWGGGAVIALLVLAGAVVWWASTTRGLERTHGLIKEDMTRHEVYALFGKPPDRPVPVAPGAPSSVFDGDEWYAADGRVVVHFHNDRVEFAVYYHNADISYLDRVRRRLRYLLGH